MNDDLQLSNDGANLIKVFEGCKEPIGGGKFKAYLDPIGVLTIGYGHTNHHGRKFDAAAIWTQAQCDEAFAEDMADFEQAVRRLVTVPLNQHQFDALVSFTYNCGEGNLEKSSLLRRLNNKDYDGAALEFHRWNRAGGKVFKGLVRRRASEALLFQGIPDKNYDGKSDIERGPHHVMAMPQKVDQPSEFLF